jgi:intracellular sulfur oxidation DsrE/DsrF family protein
MKKKMFIFALLLSTGAALAQHKVHRVVIQLSTNDTTVWRNLMGNISHLKETLGEKTQIEVVAYSFGIELLVSTKSTQKKHIAEFAAMGVSFMGCENSMRIRNIVKGDLVPGVGTVPSGVSELVLKQEQDWSYLKAGF